jgi:hypothetical protein
MDVARRVIASESKPSHNPIDSSEAELNKSAVINSALRLRHLMLSDAVSEELRVCYAISIVEQKIQVAISLKSQSLTDSLRDTQTKLAVLLRQIQSRKP